MNMFSTIINKIALGAYRPVPVKMIHKKKNTAILNKMNTTNITNFQPISTKNNITQEPVFNSTTPTPIDEEANFTQTIQTPIPQPKQTIAETPSATQAPSIAPSTQDIPAKTETPTIISTPLPVKLETPSPTPTAVPTLTITPTPIPVIETNFVRSSQANQLELLNSLNKLTREQRSDLTKLYPLPYRAAIFESHEENIKKGFMQKLFSSSEPIPQGEDGRWTVSGSQANFTAVFYQDKAPFYKVSSFTIGADNAKCSPRFVSLGLINDKKINLQYTFSEEIPLGKSHTFNLHTSVESLAATLYIHENYGANETCLSSITFNGNLE